jgi:hypothetical protein
VPGAEGDQRVDRHGRRGGSRKHGGCPLARCYRMRPGEPHIELATEL